MVDINLTEERLNELLSKLDSLGLKTKFKLAIDKTLRVGLRAEDVLLKPALQTKAFELTFRAVSDRLAVEFAEELLKQFCVVAEEDRKNNPTSAKSSRSRTRSNGRNGTKNEEQAGANTTHGTGPPLTRKEVYNDLRGFLEKNRSRFNFKDQVLQDMAAATAAQGRKIQRDLGLNDQELVGLAAVSLYDIVFLCDDSGSMNTGNRINTLFRTLQSVADWATRLEPTGVSIRFLNLEKDGDGRFDNLTSLDSIKDVFHYVDFEGVTDLGAATRAKILGRRLKQNERVGLEKPLIVAIITDGEPTDEDPKCFEKTLIEFKRSLPEGSTIFILFQIGDTQEAKDFIEDIGNSEYLEDSLYCSTSDLSEIWDRLSRTITAGGKGDEKGYKRHMLKEFIKAVTKEVHGGSNG